MKRTHTRQDSRERRIVASGERELQVLPISDRIAARTTTWSVPRMLDHARDYIAHEPADADGAVLATLVVAREPLLDADLFDDLAALGVVEFSRQAGFGAVCKGRVERVHDATEAWVAVYFDRGRVGRHPFPNQVVEVGHFSAIVPARGGAVGEGLGKLGEAFAGAFVWEECLVAC